MKYKFSFVYDGLHVQFFECEAKTLNDALSQFSIYACKENYKITSFGYYYSVDNNGRVSKRIFSPALQYRFLNFCRICAAMDKEYGIDK